VPLNRKIGKAFVRSQTRGLPDVTLSFQKIPILVYFGMDNVGICYGYFDYFTAIWYILRPFGIFFGH
jgi:hypothetical protein